jgi:hypothetical protein
VTETPTTPTAEDWRSHQQPCFCDRCWCTTLMDLIGERAVLLQGALKDRLYADGMERDMADEVIAAIPAAQRLEVLTHMLTWDHLMPRVVNVDCLLNECEESSYKALEEMGAILLAEIRAQGREGTALRILVTKEICDPIVALVHGGLTGNEAA